MFRTRSVAGLLLALTLGLVASGLSVAPASAAPEPKIWGVVTDGKGVPILGVEVVAVDESGEPAASDLSYDDPDGDQAPRPGYFELYVGSNGTYTVTLKKDGKVFAPLKIRGVEVARGNRVVELGEVALLRTTKTSGKLDRAEIRADEKGKVEVTVTPGKPAGAVSVKEGRKTVGSGNLKVRNKGELTITLDKLAKGSHDLKVVYDGSAFFVGSTSGKLTLTVKAPKKKLQRPNALRYVG